MAGRMISWSAQKEVDDAFVEFQAMLASYDMVNDTRTTHISDIKRFIGWLRGDDSYSSLRNDSSPKKPMGSASYLNPSR
jgi:hypothetical protein